MESHNTSPERHGIGSISCSIEQAFEYFETREQLRIDRLGEMRGLIRPVLDLVDTPLLLIGFHAKHTLKLDYANAATASSFGASLESLEGASYMFCAGREDALRFS